MNTVIAHAGHGVIELNLFVSGLIVGAVVALVHMAYTRIKK